MTFAPRRQRRHVPDGPDAETTVQDVRGRSKRLERAEERLVPRVTREQAGTVHVRRHVVEEPEELEITVRHDELDLERRPADRALAAGEQPVTERGDTTVVLVVEERLVVRKVPWVVEEIHLRRRLVSEQRSVSDTLRKEHFQIEAEGDVELSDEP